jgi:hypothetical protein
MNRCQSIALDSKTGEVFLILFFDLPLAIPGAYTTTGSPETTLRSPCPLWLSRGPGDLTSNYAKM